MGKQEEQFDLAELQLKPVGELTAAEMKFIMEAKAKEERDQQEMERAQFEEMVDSEASQMIRGALVIREMMEDFYHQTTGSLNAMRELLNEYGKVRSNSMGGYHLKTKDGKFKIVYRYKTVNDWDARADKAEELLKDFLKGVLFKRDEDSYELIMALLEKNKEGKLEYSRIQTIYSQENRFDDPRWKEAIRLFKESYTKTGSKMVLEFYKRNEISQKWEPISLNLSSF